MKRVVHRASVLDMQAFARDAGELNGVLPVGTLSRLAASALAAPAQRREVTWHARGELRAGHGGTAQIWLHLDANCQLDLQCQRCLEPLQVALRAQRSFQFVPDEQTAAELDADSEHDVLTLEPSLDLLAILEDELLLELPQIPRHASCRAPHDTGHVVEPEARPNPFAVLAALRKEPDAS